MSWVKCPVCGEDDMHCTDQGEGGKLIDCTNINCLSNGGTMIDPALLVSEYQRQQRERKADEPH